MHYADLDIPLSRCPRWHYPLHQPGIADVAADLIADLSQRNFI